MNKILLVFLLFIVVNPFTYGQNYDLKKYLTELDKYIKNQSIYEGQKNERMSLLYKKLIQEDLSLEEEYGITMLLYKEYSTYRYDSMYVYSKKLNRIAIELGNKDLLVRSQLAIANTFLWGGLFKESSEYIQQIDTTDITKKIRIEYLSLSFDISFESGLYAKYPKYPKALLSNVYKRKMEDAIQQIEQLLTSEDKLVLDKNIKLAYYCDENDKAIKFGLRELQHIKDKQSESYSNLIGGIGYNYIDAGDTITGVKYMVDAAIEDIKRGSKQYSSIRKIAEVVYATGELDDAYKYIQLAMNNAKFFGSRYRIYEASMILPSVDNELYKLIHEKNRRITTLFIVISIFSLILLLFVIIILRQNRKLNLIRLQLNNQNDELKKSNEKIKNIIKELSEANNIKEVSVGQLFNSNLEFYNRVTNFQKSIIQKIKAKQYNDLLEFVNTSELFHEREKILSSFDGMFLRLFPNFIELFNSLLKPEDKIEIQDNGTLNPELRIFALIRLGIIKNESISKILDYSVSTVKNYKTKIKNSSVIPNEEFEKQIMEIKSAIDI